MKIVSSIDAWADAHHPKWIDIIRIFLGLLLVAKGVTFIMNNDLMISKLLESTAMFPSMMLVHYIIGVQIAAGLMIAFGLLTRVAAFFEIPILVFGLFYADLSREFFVISSELPYLILVLILLMFYTIYGSGPLSVDHYLRKHSG